MKRTFIAIALLSVLAATFSSMAFADAMSYLSARTQFSGNAGYLWVTPNSGAPNWQGPDLGGALTVSLHPQFAIYGSYDHGFPVAGSNGQFNIVRVAGSYKAWPALGVESSNSVFVNAGRGWFGRSNIRAVRSTDAGIVVSHLFKPEYPSMAVALAWSHAFADEGAGDFDFVKLCLNVH